MIIGWGNLAGPACQRQDSPGHEPAGRCRRERNRDGTTRSSPSFQTATGIKIAVYEKLYKGLDDNEHYFYPNKGCATLLPAGNLGSTWYGTTPEEADLMSGNTLADVKVVNTGVAVSTQKIALPVNIINWVSEIVLPSFESMNTVFNIKY